jgi:hypothetical protein
MTFFNLQIEDKIYKIDLYPEVRVAVTRHMMELYGDYCAVNPDKQTTFEEYLKLVETQAHPENQQQITDITNECSDSNDDIDLELALMGEAIKRKDYIIDTLLETIGKIK